MHHRYLLLGTVLTLVLFALVSSFSPLAHAASIFIDDLNDTLHSPGCADDGVTSPCSLRDAITFANTNGGADTISFSVSGTITLGSTLPAISDDLTIDGTGQTITVHGADLYRVFTINSGKTVEFKSFTITHGKIGNPGGAGIYNNSGLLTLTDMLVSNNLATRNAGGGIYSNNGSLTITNSTLSDNRVDSTDDDGTIGGGAIFNNTGTLSVTNSTFSANFGEAAAGGGGGAISSDGPTTVRNSTFSGNSPGNGTAIYMTSSTLEITNSTFTGQTGGAALTFFAGATVNITNSTIANNSGAGSGGIFAAGGASVTLRNTIVAGNTPADCAGSAVPTADAVNLDSDGTCGGATQSASVNLGALQNNGGPTQTMALLNGSAALDTGDDTVCAAPVGSPNFGAGGLDQRGVARPNPDCDVGAYERAAAAFSPGGVNGAQLWLRSDMGVSADIFPQATNTWADQSSNNFIATGSGGTRPIYLGQIFNGNPAVIFDGTDDELQIASGILGSSSYTDGNVYLVLNNNNVQPSYVFYEAPGGGQQQFSTHIPWSDNNVYWDFPYPANRISTNWGGTTGTPYLWSLLASTTATPLGNNKHIVRNGSSLANDNNSATMVGNNQPFYVGTGFDGSWHSYNGEYAEVIVFLAPLTTAQHNQIESYLAAKYGITLGSTSNLLNYTASNGATVFWTGDATYQNNVAGLGRDDGSALDQRISQSVNGGFQPHFWTGAGINYDNPGNHPAFTSDNTFIMWGDNAGTETFDVPVTAPGVDYRMARVWRTQVTGQLGSAQLTISVPDAIFSGLTNPRLLISTDPTFATVTRTPIPISCSDSGCLATFDAFTSGEYFTFAAQLNPTATNVTGVKGLVNKNGNIVLRWKTTSESQIAGFNIYRQGKQGEWKQLNANLRQAKHAGAALGDKYRFIDRKASADKTYRYKIEIVYLDGHSEWTSVIRVNRK